MEIDIITVDDYYSNQSFYAFPMPGPPLYQGIRLGVFTALYAFVFALGVGGSVLTTMVILRTKDLHSNTNFFLCNLACSDIILLISGVPSDLLYIWRPYPAIAGSWFCILKGWLSETASNASILTILVLTVERWVAVCRPLHLFVYFERSKIFHYIWFIWCIGGTAALVVVSQIGVVPYYDPRRNATNYDVTQCDIVPSRAIPYIFETCSFFLFVLPIVAIVGSYVSIIAELKQTTYSPASNVTGTLNQPQLRARYLIIKVCVLVSIIFIVCFLPLHVQRLLTTYLKHQMQNSPESATFIQTWFVVAGLMHFVSAAINPIIYNALSKRFRLACLHILRSACADETVKGGTSVRRTSYHLHTATQSTSFRSRIAIWLFRRRSSRNDFYKHNQLIDANGNDAVGREVVL